MGLLDLPGFGNNLLQKADGYATCSKESGTGPCLPPSTSVLGRMGCGGQDHRALREESCDGPEEGVRDAQGDPGVWWREGLNKHGSKEGRDATGGGASLPPHPTTPSLQTLGY